MTPAALLLLADSRLPAGGHAHSGGLEAAVDAGRVRDVSTLDGFLRGRLATTGLVTAAFAAAAAAGHDPGVLDRALDARTPSPALRKVSRQQGRALLRAACAMWPEVRRGPCYIETGVAGAPPDSAPHYAVALGSIACAAGLTPHDAALVAAYQAITGPASAAVRLLGLDPYAVQRLLADLAPACDEVAATALARSAGPVEALPATAPLLDITAEIHASKEVRLFAS